MAFEVGAMFGELRTPLDIDELGNGIGEAAFRIVKRGYALGFCKYRPARAKAAQRIVEPRRDGDEFGWGGAVKVGSSKARGSLERAVLVEHHPRRDEGNPGQEIGKGGRSAAIFAQGHHGRIQLG